MKPKFGIVSRRLHTSYFVILHPASSRFIFVLLALFFFFFLTMSYESKIPLSDDTIAKIGLCLAIPSFIGSVVMLGFASAEFNQAVCSDSNFISLALWLIIDTVIQISYFLLSYFSEKSIADRRYSVAFSVFAWYIIGAVITFGHIGDCDTSTVRIIAWVRVIAPLAFLALVLCVAMCMCCLYCVAVCFSEQKKNDNTLTNAAQFNV